MSLQAASLDSRVFHVASIGATASQYLHGAKRWSMLSYSCLHSIRDYIAWEVAQGSVTIESFSVDDGLT